MVTGIDVARQFALLAVADGELLDQMRLYKLMYYAQGWSLAWFLEPLFDDRIEAWKLGPVPIGICNELATFGSNPIRGLGQPVRLIPRAVEVIDSVWHGYRKHSSIGLSELTHDESPWRDAYIPDASGRCENAITHEALLAYFGKRFEDESGEHPGRLSEVDSAYANGTTRSLEDILALTALHAH